MKAALHILLTIPSIGALLASAVMAALKLAEIGAGPTLGWSLIIGLAVASVVALAIDAAILTAAASREIEEFKSQGFDHPFFRDRGSK